ncbi:MAG: hypothetical protein M1834_000875 [Cirrosporium novae-zelandiae]|nr:MAG: hypothetical protein M1834_000875 [Cirrosporium novae-zelandiae]
MTSSIPTSNHPPKQTKNISSLATSFSSPSPPLQAKPPPKTSLHTLVRVRNNQRRHRARRREYISSLEEQLHDTEKRLEEAREEIKSLKLLLVNSNEKRIGPDEVPSITSDLVGNDSGVISSELENGYNASEITTDLSIPGPEDTSIAAVGTEYNFNEIEPRVEAIDNMVEGWTNNPILDDLGSPFTSISGSTSMTSISTMNPIFPLMSSPFSISEMTTFVPVLAMNLEENSSESFLTPSCCSSADSCRLPTPIPTEPTTLCSIAFTHIQARNIRGVDPVTIKMWLSEGFRKGRWEGEGCRVENSVLYALLDFIWKPSLEQILDSRRERGSGYQSELGQPYQLDGHNIFPCTQW